MNLPILQLFVHPQLSWLITRHSYLIGAQHWKKPYRHDQVSISLANTLTLHTHWKLIENNWNSVISSWRIDGYQYSFCVCADLNAYHRHPKFVWACPIFLHLFFPALDVHLHPMLYHHQMLLFNGGNEGTSVITQTVSRAMNEYHQNKYILLFEINFLTCVWVKFEY